MTQRINPNTGYPMSTEKQIKLAQENLKMAQHPYLSTYEQANKLSKEVGFDGRTKEEKYKQYMTMRLSSLISIIPEKADLAYKLGEWNMAENEYLKISFLDIHYANKLRIIYQKEKRFKDAYFIMRSTRDIGSFLQNIWGAYSKQVEDKFDHNLQVAKEKAEKNKAKDRSLIIGEKQVSVVLNINQKLNQIKQWSEIYLNKEEK